MGMFIDKSLCIIVLQVYIVMKFLATTKLQYNKTKQACPKTASGLGVNDQYQWPVLLNFQKVQNTIASLFQNLPICTPISTNMVICQI